MSVVLSTFLIVMFHASNHTKYQGKTKKKKRNNKGLVTVTSFMEKAGGDGTGVTK